MTLFNRLHQSDLHVRVNYGKADVCGTGPFMWIRANKIQVEQLIDSQLLIERLRPPLSFPWRKALFYWVFGMIALTMALTLAFVLVINSYDQSEINTFTFAFLGLLGIIICLQFFEKQLVAYIQGLNESQFYRKGYCWGKNINVLGIRRIDSDKQILINNTLSTF